MKRVVQFLSGALLGIVIAACGGGGGNTVAEGGIGGTGISSGSISAFGSIVVNGTTFDVEPAQITVNGQLVPGQDSLDVGYVVQVDGDLTTGIAETVRFEADVIGEVDSNPMIVSGDEVGAIRVAQQRVLIKATTVLAGIETPSEIPEGARVQVSGFRNSVDELVATHVQTGPSDIDQVVGEVTSNPITSTSFLIGDLTVFSTANVDDGDRVLLRGNYDPAAQSFTPSEPIEFIEDVVVTGREIEIEGFIDDVFPNKVFRLDGIVVDAGGSGVEIVDEANIGIVQDAKVEVEGVFDSSGVLVADRVEIELEDNVEIVAKVVGVDRVSTPQTVSFFDPGSGIPMVTVEVNGKTRLRDDTGGSEGAFSLDQIFVDDWLELDGFEDNTTGKITALKIERFIPESNLADQEVSVEGIVDSTDVLNDELRILGVKFDTEFASFDGVTLDTIQEGIDIVEVTWAGDTSFTQPPSGHPVDKVELEKPDD